MINDPQSAESAVPSDADAEHVQPESGDQTADRIVVGIRDSGADHYRAALGLAARMSRQRAAPITLIHGSLPRLAIAASWTEALQRHLAHGREMVEEARLALSSMVDPSTRVHAEAVPKTGVDALLQESRTAATLILQRRNLSALGRAFNSATSHTVAAQAACPVIVVRHDQLDSDSKPRRRGRDRAPFGGPGAAGWRAGGSRTEVPAYRRLRLGSAVFAHVRRQG